MMTWLWERLSDGGAETTVSGRALRRFPVRDIDHLFRAGVLIEQRTADCWSVCAHCDCGLDARPIREIGDAFHACCPHDATQDLVLNGDDLSRYSVDAERLAGKIAASGGLAGSVARIGDGIGLMGRTPAGHAVVLCSDCYLLETPGMILAIRAAVGGERVTVVASSINAGVAIRWQEAGLSTMELGKAMIGDQHHLDRLAPERIFTKPQVEDLTADAARLQVSRSRRTVRLDGRDFVLSLTEFDAFLGAAEKVAVGQVMLTYQELYALTNRATHRDVINEIRDKLQKQGLTREQAFDLVKTVHGRGVTFGLPGPDIDIRD